MNQTRYTITRISYVKDMVMKHSRKFTVCSLLKRVGFEGNQTSFLNIPIDLMILFAGIFFIVLLIALWSGYTAHFEHANVLRTTAGIEYIRNVFTRTKIYDPFAPDQSERARLKLIKSLDEISSPEESVSVILELLMTYGIDRRLKQQALVTLGKMGTKTSIEAIRKFEAWAERIRLNPPHFQFGIQDPPLLKFHRYALEPTAKAKDQNGTEWAIFVWNRFHRGDYWLTKAKGNNEWSTPILLNIPRVSGKHFELLVKGQKFVLTVDDVNLDFNLQEQLQDSDGDGLTDVVEQSLQTDSHHPDTDKDGTPDGKDGNPLTPKHEVTDLRAIRQAAFFILLATCNSQDNIFVYEKYGLAEQEYYGHRGYVLRSQKEWAYPWSLVWIKLIDSIDLEPKFPTDATVEIWYGAGPLSGSRYEARLRKIYGKWVVVEFRGTGIS